MSVPTPKYDLRDYPQVYEPREDSFLFLDALEADIEFLRQLQPKFAAEIGSGSGIVITALASILKNNCMYFATDINPQACEATLTTSIMNGCCINCLNMHLLSCFKQNLFDVVLFNPPYVVTQTEEIFGNGLSRAWAGGKNGREITDRLLLNLDKLLTQNGVCYLVLLKENNIEDIETLMHKRKFKMVQIIDRKNRGEHLFVVKFTRIL